MLTICFHSSPVKLEFLGLKLSQSFKDNVLIILRSLLKEYSEIFPDIILDNDDDSERGIPSILIAKALLLSTP